MCNLSFCTKTIYIIGKSIIFSIIFLLHLLLYSLQKLSLYYSSIKSTYIKG